MSETRIHLSAPRRQPGHRLRSAAWVCLVASPLWFLLLLLPLYQPLEDASSPAVELLLSLPLLAPAIATLVLSGLAFRAGRRWHDLLPGMIALVLAVALPVMQILDPQASTGELVVGGALAAGALALLLVTALWPRRRSPEAPPDIDVASHLDRFVPPLPRPPQDAAPTESGRQEHDLTA